MLLSVNDRIFPFFQWENSAQSLTSVPDVKGDLQYMNKEKYKQKFGKVEPKEIKKNKTCWYKDCGYCLKYHTKCFNCHTND